MSVLSVSDPGQDEWKLVSHGMPWDAPASWRTHHWSQWSHAWANAGTPRSQNREPVATQRSQFTQTKQVSPNQQSATIDDFVCLCLTLRGSEVTRVCPWTGHVIVDIVAIAPSQVGSPSSGQLRGLSWCQRDNGELGVLASSVGHQQSVSINIEIWLTIKIIIMRKQPHPVVTLDHYKHSNTDKLRQADRGVRKPD